MALLAALGGCMTQWTPTVEQIEAASRKAEGAANQLFQRLSSELAAAISTGGAEAAIRICKDRARAIGEEIEAASGVDIERTALRLRNSVNAPDDWERAVMASFLARRQAGEEWSTMTATRIEGGKLRWMRPIPLGAMCTSCHGDPASMDGATLQSLRANYPADEATGFAVGDLRGAFSARADMR